MNRSLYYIGLDNNKGGLENFAKQLLTGIVSSRPNFDITVISCYSDYAYRDYLESLGIKSIIIPNHKKHPYKYYKALLNLFKNNSDALVHLNIMSYKNLMLFRALKRSGIKCVITGHASSTTSRINYLLHKYGRYIYRNIGKKVVIEKNDFMFHKSCDVSVINNGFDIARFMYDEDKRVSLRDKYYMDDKFAIGMVGRISYLKNQSFMIKVMEHITNSNMVLYLVGKNQDQKVLDYISEHIINNVIYLGELDNINELYNAFDLLVVPSISEGFGLVIYEGLTNGLDVVVSATIPKATYINEHITYLPLDIEAWVNYIKSYNKTRGTVPPLGIDHYDIKVTTKKYLDVYDNLLTK